MYVNESDVHEVFDLVKRKGPVTFNELMRQVSTYSTDEVATALERLEDVGKVEHRPAGLGSGTWVARGDA